MQYKIREIRAEDDDKICNIIKAVGSEYGAIGDGFGPSDLEVQCMSKHYSEQKNSLYLVAEINNQLVGGGGIAAFQKSNEICELRKLFLLPTSRGSGIGKKLTQECLKFAKSKSYKKCYLDTLSNMTSAIALYESLGFTHLKHPLEETIHGGCDVWMLKNLQ